MKAETHWMGLTSFSEALGKQAGFLKKAQQSKGGQRQSDLDKAENVFFLGMEHPLVVTLGLRSKKDFPVESYEKNFPEVFPIDRGGHSVIHNPGQLVIYPIINIREMGLTVRNYVSLLVEATENLLNFFGIETFQKEEPGLFTRRGKIALFGVGVKRGVTCHGLCVNVSNDLEDFKKIPVCGVQGQPMDRMSQYISLLSTEKLFFQWVDFFMMSLKDNFCSNLSKGG